MTKYEFWESQWTRTIVGLVTALFGIHDICICIPVDTHTQYSEICIPGEWDHSEYCTVTIVYWAHWTVSAGFGSGIVGSGV